MFFDPREVGEQNKKERPEPEQQKTEPWHRYSATKLIPPRML